MKKLLHIVATPRGDDSRTLRVTKAFLESFKTTHPDWTVEELDLTKEKLPSMTVKRVDGKYVLLGGKDLSEEQQEAWREIVAYINKFLSVDGYLISVPMWNFSIPYMLKHYIDIIIQPKYLFRYTSSGAEGLVRERKMVVITSRGGDYSTPETRGFDLQEQYLRAIFGLVGITDVRFINAQPMDMGMDVQRQRLEEAQTAAKITGEGF